MTDTLMPAKDGLIGAAQRRFAVSLSSLLILAGVTMTPFGNVLMTHIL